MKIFVALTFCFSLVAITQSISTADVKVLQNAEATLEAAEAALAKVKNTNVSGLSQPLKTSLDTAVKNLNTQINSMSPLLFKIALVGNSASTTTSLNNISSSINGSITTIQSILARVG